MADITLHRVFHPVGQGAFYSETFNIGANKICMVYDCGNFYKDEYLTKAIQDCKLPNIIDFLFISHFDKDHVSGIPDLLKGRTVKHVFLPFIYKNQPIIRDIVSLLVTDGVQNFNALFEGVEIIYINPLSESLNFSEELEFLPIPDNIDNSFSFKILGQVVQIHLSTRAFWEYIPYQLPLQDNEAEKLLAKFEEDVKQRLCKYGSVNDDLPKLIKQAFNTNTDAAKKDLREAYDGIIKKKLNRYSLCLLSKPCFSKIGGTKKKHQGLVCWSYFSNFFNVAIPKTSCLYTGDYEALYAAKKNYGQNLCLYYNKFLPKIGTLQIPHHESKNNSDKDFYDKFPNLHIGVCAFGLKNSPSRHPDKEILGIICEKNLYFIPVTEFSCSKLTERFIF